LVFILPVLIHILAKKEEEGSWGYIRTPFHIAFLLLGVALSVGQFLPTGSSSSSTPPPPPSPSAAAIAAF